MELLYQGVAIRVMRNSSITQTEFTVFTVFTEFAQFIEFTEFYSVYRVYGVYRVHSLQFTVFKFWYYPSEYFCFSQYDYLTQMFAVKLKQIP